MTGRILLAATAAAAVAVDAATKVAAVRYLDDRAIPLGEVLTLRLVYNPGVAFGIGAWAPAPLVIGVTGLAVAALVIMAWRGALQPPFAAGLVVGGGVANLADRLAGGTVVDMFDLGWWPVFNLADVVLLTGVTLVMLCQRRPSTASTQLTPRSADDGYPAAHHHPGRRHALGRRGPGPTVVCVHGVGVLESLLRLTGRARRRD